MHTPAPWKINFLPKSNNGHKDNLMIEYQSPAVAIFIAEIPGGRHFEDAKSNAYLIAAAPELLRALKKSAQNIEQLCEMVNTLAGFRKVRAEDFGELAYKAIEKAEGES